MEGQMDRWMDGWMDGLMEGRTAKQTETLIRGKEWENNRSIMISYVEYLVSASASVLQ